MPTGFVHVTRNSSSGLQGLLKAVLAIALFGVVLLALFVAWWLALLLIGLWMIVATVRNALSGNRRRPRDIGSPAASPHPTVIEGEFRVEHSEDIHAQIDDSGGDTPKPGR